MDFDPTNLIAGIVVSGIGYVLFTYGRRMSRPPHLAVGLLMLVYPYFVPGALVMGSIAVVLLALLWAAVKFGY
jgi:hypothetical protein